MFKEEKMKNIIGILLSAILVIFIWHKFLVSGNTVIFLLIFVSMYYVIKKTIEKENKKKFAITAIISLIFALVEVICTSINIDYTLNHVLDKWTIINFLGYAILGWVLISNAYNLFERERPSTNNTNIIYTLLMDNKWSFYINAIIIFLAWLPYFLRYYPGLLTNDSCSQVSQSIGLAMLTNHHPVFHTGLVALFVNIGQNIFHDLNIGVALYTVFQMIAMSLIFSTVINYLKKKEINSGIRMIVLLYYMFYPINALFSVTMWKDILFSGLLSIFIMLSAELVVDTETFLNNKKDIIWYIIVSILVSYMRNNGIYVIVLTMPFIIVALRKYWKKILFMFSIIIVIYFSTKTIIFHLLNVQKGSIAEMMSIPLQQIARVYKYHSEDLDESDFKEINNIFECSDIGDRYIPTLSDPVKAQLNVEYFTSNKGRFIKLWFKLLIKYPKDYIESFISNSYGYYYPEAKNWVANRTMEQNSMGLEQRPIIKGTIVSKIDSLIEKRDIPLISMCFSIGMAFWIIVTCFGYRILKQDYKSMLIYVPLFILWLTIVASPVFCEYRYAYSLFTTLPLYISLNFIKRKELQNGKNSSTNTML